MRAKIYGVNRDALDQDAYIKIALGNSNLAKAMFQEMNGKPFYLFENDIELEGYEYRDTPDHKAHAFLEECFEHTALSEAWEGKRPISVGDIVEIIGGNTWFCASMGWVKVK